MIDSFRLGSAPPEVTVYCPRARVAGRSPLPLRSGGRQGGLRTEWIPRYGGEGARLSLSILFTLFFRHFRFKSYNRASRYDLTRDHVSSPHPSVGVPDEFRSFFDWAAPWSTGIMEGPADVVALGCSGIDAIGNRRTR